MLTSMRDYKRALVQRLQQRAQAGGFQAESAQIRGRLDATAAQMRQYEDPLLQVRGGPTQIRLSFTIANNQLTCCSPGALSVLPPLRRARAQSERSRTGGGLGQERGLVHRAAAVVQDRLLLVDGQAQLLVLWGASRTPRLQVR
jgi:hypothetical protein